MTDLFAFLENIAVFSSWNNKSFILKLDPVRFHELTHGSQSPVYESTGICYPLAMHDNRIQAMGVLVMMTYCAQLAVNKRTHQSQKGFSWLGGAFGGLTLIFVPGCWLIRNIIVLLPMMRRLELMNA